MFITCVLTTHARVYMNWNTIQWKKIGVGFEIFILYFSCRMYWSQWIINWRIYWPLLHCVTCRIRIWKAEPFAWIIPRLWHEKYSNLWTLINIDLAFITTNKNGILYTRSSPWNTNFSQTFQLKDRMVEENRGGKKRKHIVGLWGVERKNVLSS